MKLMNLEIRSRLWFMNMRKVLVIVLISIVYFSAFGQQDTIIFPSDTLVREEIDSLQQVQVDRITSLLKVADSTRVADSIAKKKLVDQINALKTTDNIVKEDLMKRLKSIESDDSMRFVEKRKRIDSLKALTIGYPVQPFTDTLFLIYNRLGAFSARDRANNIAFKIEMLSDMDISSDELEFTLRHNRESTDLEVDGEVILSVTDEDALWMEMSREQLAIAFQERIRTELDAYFESNQIKTIIFRSLGVIAVIVFLFLLIFYINTVFRFFKRKIYAQKGNLIKGVKLKNYEFLTAHRLIQLYFTLLDILKVVIVVLALYIALPVLFSIFPWTQGLADKLFGYILDPLNSVFKSIVSYIPKLFTIAVIFLIIRYLLKFVYFLTREIEKGDLEIPGFYSDWARPTFNIIRFLMYAFMFTIIFPYLPGSDSEIFKGVTVFLGVLISLGSTSAISNMVAGLVITYMRPYKVGDRVKIGEVTGDVIEKTLLVTRIKTIKNEEITVPNAAILSGHTTNYSSVANEAGLIVHTTVTIGYDVPWQQVHELLIDAAKKTNGIVKEKSPFILQTSLDDFYVSYQVNAYTNQAKKVSQLLSDLHQNIQDVFARNEVEIMSPHYRSERDGNTITIPNRYEPKSPDA